MCERERVREREREKERERESERERERCGGKSVGVRSKSHVMVPS